MTNAILRGKPDAGNPHVRFDEGEVASVKPRRGSLLYTGLPGPAVPSIPRLMLQGHEVFAFAVRKLAKVVEALCERQSITPDALDRVYAHQANRRIIEATARRMKIPLDRFWINLETTANTSSASIPIALDESVRSGELRNGMKIVLAGFGSGLTWGGTYSVWPDF